MYSILLVIIYVSFISLGLPDALLGSAWPSMRLTLDAPVSYAGVISMIIAGGTIVSSLASARLTQKLGTGRLTAVSVAMTAVALFGFSVSASFWQLCLWAVPYGLGAGSVDAALNDFVARHYAARHMSWLHCFWGLGASFGPYIMGWCLTAGFAWNQGYQSVALIQAALTAALLCSLPLWRTERREQKAARDAGPEKTDGQTKDGKSGKSGVTQGRLMGKKPTLVSFFCYCALEASAGLWAATYLVAERGLSAQMAAKWASLFYIGITAGRFLSGFITLKLEDKQMVRLGQLVAAVGIACLLLPLGQEASCAGLVLVGMGCAPVFPSLLHATPARFGAGASQSMMGQQMASAYVGTTFVPPLFGAIQSVTGIGVYPFYLLAILVIMIVMTERVNRIMQSAV